MGLDNIPVHQISAGTSHSVAWTAIPTDRKVGYRGYQGNKGRLPWLPW